MRISSHASEQYRKTSDIAEKRSEKKSVEPQARTKTTSFGFRLGKFGVSYEEQSTTLDPSLSRDVRQRKEKASAFQTEAEVENLRTQIGAEGAGYRNTQTEAPTMERPSQNRVRAALDAYTRSQSTVLPPPGNMLASVV